MFAPRYFGVRHYAPRYFAPGVVLEQGAASSSGARRIMPAWFQVYIGDDQRKKERRELIEAKADIVSNPEILSIVSGAISDVTKGRTDGKIGREKIILQSRTRRKVVKAIRDDVVGITGDDSRVYLDALIEAVQLWHEVELYKTTWRRKRDNEALAILLLEM